MKNLKNFYLQFLLFFISLIVINGCSNESETVVNENASSKVETFLKKFYSESYHLGKSMETNLSFAPSQSQLKSKEFEDVILTEVYVGNDARARGYIIADKITNDFLYFLDVDRTDFKLTEVSIEANETRIFEDINDLDKYLSTNELDYIKIAEDLENGNSTIEANKFWGWGDMFGGPCVGGIRIMYHTYYVFGIPMVTKPVKALDGISSLQEPCD